MGKGAASHVAAVRHFPSGGWGAAWMGDPDGGFGKLQPGGWMYNLLPFMELKSMHDMAKTGGTSTVQATPQKKALISGMCQIPLGVFNCPTRRKLIAYSGDVGIEAEGDYVDAGRIPYHARSDYAGCGGSGGTYYNTWGRSPMRKFKLGTPIPRIIGFLREIIVPISPHLMASFSSGARSNRRTLSTGRATRFSAVKNISPRITTITAWTPEIAAQCFKVTIGTSSVWQTKIGFPIEIDRVLEPGVGFLAARMPPPSTWPCATDRFTVSAMISILRLGPTSAADAIKELSIPRNSLGSNLNFDKPTSISVSRRLRI